MNNYTNVEEYSKYSVTNRSNIMWTIVSVST